MGVVLSTCGEDELLAQRAQRHEGLLRQEQHGGRKRRVDPPRPAVPQPCGQDLRVQVFEHSSTQASPAGTASLGRSRAYPAFTAVVADQYSRVKQATC